MKNLIDIFEHVCYYFSIEEESYGRKEGEEDY